LTHQLFSKTIDKTQSLDWKLSLSYRWSKFWQLFIIGPNIRLFTELVVPISAPPLTIGCKEYPS